MVCALSMMAQERSMTGFVRSDQGETLPMATILILPDSLMLTSDGEGRFVVSIAEGIKRVRISYTGYQTLLTQVVIASDTVVNLAMVPEVAP